jgi:hypothetical protein
MQSLFLSWSSLYKTSALSPDSLSFRSCKTFIFLDIHLYTLLSLSLIHSHHNEVLLSRRSGHDGRLWHGRRRPFCL